MIGADPMPSVLVRGDMIEPFARPVRSYGNGPSLTTPLILSRPMICSMIGLKDSAGILVRVSALFSLILFKAVICTGSHLYILTSSLILLSNDFILSGQAGVSHWIFEDQKEEFQELKVLATNFRHIRDQEKLSQVFPLTFVVG